MDGRYKAGHSKEAKEVGKLDGRNERVGISETRMSCLHVSLMDSENNQIVLPTSYK